MLTVTLVALIAAVDQDYQAVITSASYAFRSTGSTIGIATASAIFQNILTSRLHEALRHEHNSEALIRRIRDNLDFIKILAPATIELVQGAYMQALTAVFLTLFGLAALGAAVSLFMKEHKLHNNLSRRSSSASEVS